jgi:hypothetical protein
MEQEINLAMNIFNGISIIGQLREEHLFQRFSPGTAINNLSQQETVCRQEDSGDQWRLECKLRPLGFDLRLTHATE